MNSPFQKFSGKDVLKLIAAKKLVEAETLAKGYLRQNAANADAQNALARVYVAKNNRGLAMPHAEAAHRLVPDNLDYAFLLGRLYLDLDLYEFAYPLLIKVQQRYPTSFLINWALGDYLLSIGQGPKARPYFEKAIAALPDGEQRQLATLNLCDCLIAEGRGTETEDRLMMLRHVPNLRATAMSMLALAGKRKPDSPVGQELQALLKSESLTVDDRSEFWLALGRLFENAKMYDEAFDAWTASRKLLGVSKFSVPRIRERQGKWRAFYSRELLTSCRPYAHNSTLPVFVIGMPRSATTLTEQIIAAHSKAYGVGELNRMGKLAAAMTRDYDFLNHVSRVLSNAQKGEIKARAEETLELYRAIGPSGKQVIVEKTPFNFEAAGYINLCFPNAKFIHTRRHPADNFISAFQNRMNSNHDYSYDQVAYVQRYLLQEELMNYWKSVFPKQIFTLQYEKLVADPEPTVRELLAFLGLEYEPQCLKFFERQSTVRTFSTDQVRSAIYTSSVERWRNYEKHLGPLFATLKAANFEYR
jgi:tetratricopeptide (TPR) repeat protein